MTVENDQSTAPPPPDLTLVTGTQPVPQTFTYQVEADEGIYLVKISPEPLTTLSELRIQYDIDGRIMHVDPSASGRKMKIRDLQILKFTPRAK